jgi:hypothetical protein
MSTPKKEKQTASFLRERLTTILHGMLDQFAVERCEKPNEENVYTQNRFQLVDIASLSASISLLTVADAYERMSDSLAGTFKALAKRIP